jgi:hypothetical protein
MTQPEKPQTFHTYVNHLSHTHGHICTMCSQIADEFSAGTVAPKERKKKKEIEDYNCRDWKPISALCVHNQNLVVTLLKRR